VHDAHEPDPPSRGTGPSGFAYEPEPYCDFCERTGHTFRSCPARDDEPDEAS
jgi:hypothetical protein